MKVPLDEPFFEAVNLILVPASAHKKLVSGHKSTVTRATLQCTMGPVAVIFHIYEE